jgi:hypothetical protein
MSLFVSSFIDLNEYEERLSTKNLEEYIKNSVRLLTLTEKAKYILFVTENIKQKLKEVIGERINISYHVITIEELPISKLLDPIKDQISLPKTGMALKDTYNYYKLMCSKTYFLEKAMEIDHESTHFTWIDLGILHIIKESEMEEFGTSLLKINEYREYHIRFPGCQFSIDRYNKNVWMLDTVKFRDRICWIFFGGLLTGSREALKIFAQEVSNFLIRFEKEKYIMWEVNVWADIYYKKMSIFQPYFVKTHNIEMLSLF